ncbi:glycosyltransferase family 4 protein [Endozoicomonas sp. G2_1]|uniref:glycosyltransferase family 4 protein n=1 Tax=Endozoicomonas sp. G2_1 TaxID=2821091 RepID=UPI001AD9AEF2|nr:glycosyltransferase family 4 protein [Endozoicomonas sp. G2_1]MBO9490489.1 glycosyltransferase family 4 protein [Endozoicomonas sp. G2_1]
MTKKKIVHLTYDMRIGGTETVIKNLVEGTDKALFDVEILCIEPELGPFGQQLLDKGYNITNLNWLGGFDREVIKNIRQFIKKHDIDILHCHQYTPWVYGTLAATLTKTKVIFTEHGRFYPDSSSWKRKLINPILVAMTDHITTISKATKQALVKYEFIPESKIEVIYNGIEPLVPDIDAVERLKSDLKIPHDAKILGTVARLDPIKNQTMMLRAFAQVLKEYPNTFLVIVGDGEERTNLENLTDTLDIRNHVRFVGYIAKPVNHIQLMDIFLLSSLSEGTSMTLLEAMSLGKPFVVTNVGGNPEVVNEYNNGLVTQNDNCGNFSFAIEQLLLSEGTLNNYGENSRSRFQDNFCRSKMVYNYFSLKTLKANKNQYDREGKDVK